MYSWIYLSELLVNSDPFIIVPIQHTSYFRMLLNKNKMDYLIISVIHIVAIISSIQDFTIEYK